MTEVKSISMYVGTGTYSLKQKKNSISINEQK